MESLVEQLRFLAVTSGTLALHFALLLLLAANSPPGGSSAAASTPPTTSHFQNRIAAFETRTGGRIAVAALDTGNSKRLDYRLQERFPMCSTFKPSRPRRS